MVCHAEQGPNFWPDLANSNFQISFRLGVTIRCVVADTRFVFVTFPKYFHVPEVRGAITSSFVASERAKLFLGAGARQIQSVD